MAGVSRDLACFLLIVSIASHSVVAHKSKRCHEHRVLDSGVPCDVKDEILRIHNEHRRQMKDGGRLRQLYWDDELARKAQGLADDCSKHKYDIRKNVDDSHDTSQSISYIGSHANSKEANYLGFPISIEHWLNKDKQAESPLSPRSNADTYLIGCGYTRYRKTLLRAISSYVCNYAPSSVKRVHNKPASECLAPLKNSSDYPGLCGMEHPPNNECVEISNDEVPNVPDDARNQEFDLKTISVATSTVDYDERSLGQQDLNDAPKLVMEDSKSSNEVPLTESKTILIPKEGSQSISNSKRIKRQTELQKNLSQLLSNLEDKSSNEVSSTDSEVQSSQRDNKSARSNVRAILDKAFQQITDPKSKTPKNNNPITINIFEL